MLHYTVIPYSCNINAVHKFNIINFSPQPKNAEEGQLKIATKPSAKIEDSYEDEMYEVIEMQATSEKLAKTRYAPAQMPQEGLVEIQPIESENEASKDSAGKGDINQEAYEVINVD